MLCSLTLWQLHTCLFFGCETAFAQNVILDLSNSAALLLIQWYPFSTVPDLFSLLTTISAFPKFIDEPLHWYNPPSFGSHTFTFWWTASLPLCITASRNILASRNFCFRVFELKLKVINKVFFICIVNEMKVTL